VEKVEAANEHRWLKKLVGEWTSEAQMASDAPVGENCRGSESVRTLGDLWVLCEGTGDMPGGGTARMLMTLGYDPARQRFVGTWVGSMMTHLWVYEGTLDAAQRMLTLESEGPSMTGDGKTSRYRDVIAFVSDDHRTLTSHARKPDGSWQPFMTAHYRRR
jgi:hypothetical protein